MISKSVNLVWQKINTDDIQENELMMSPDFFFEKIDVCDILEQSENEELFQNVCNKITSNGKIVIRGVDGVAISSMVSNGDLNIDALNDLMKKIKRFNSLVKFKQFFVENNWRIDYAGYTDGYRYIIEAIKP